jgi:8-oxo-dGTP pyrophosphatase MutT (NUDIX family)
MRLPFSDEIVEPRPSASVLVVRDAPLQVLMMRRPAKGTFAGALVFPGGTVDPEDHDSPITTVDDRSGADRAQRIAGIRETFEETGLTIASDAALSGPRSEFSAIALEAGASFDLDALHEFGHWITPVGFSRRYDVHFYLAEAPAGAEAVVEGDEVVSFEWVSPASATARVADGDNTIMFPTLMNLQRLAESTTVAEAIAAVAAREPFTVTPVLTRVGDDARLSIPAEAGYSVTEYDGV